MKADCVRPTSVRYWRILSTFRRAPPRTTRQVTWTSQRRGTGRKGRKERLASECLASYRASTPRSPNGCLRVCGNRDEAGTSPRRCSPGQTAGSFGARAGLAWLHLQTHVPINGAIHRHALLDADDIEASPRWPSAARGRRFWRGPGRGELASPPHGGAGARRPNNLHAFREGRPARITIARARQPSGPRPTS